MPPNEKKEPIEDLKDKLRSFFDPRNPQKKKDALPPNAHFSIWYFLMAFHREPNRILFDDLFDLFTSLTTISNNHLSLKTETLLK